MIARRLLILFALCSFAASAQYCDFIDQRDADAILGGPAVPLGLGAMGCSYSVRGKAGRLTLTLSNEGANAKKGFDTLKKNTKAPGYFVSEELTLGVNAFSEWVKPVGGLPAKLGFIVLKDTKLIQFYVDGPAVQREKLDKLRVMAKRIVDKI